MPPPGNPPKLIPQTSIFRLAQTRVPVFFDINRYLTDKYFYIVWECSPPGTPKVDSKNQFLCDQIYCDSVFDISKYLRGKYFDRVWGYHPRGPPK